MNQPNRQSTLNQWVDWLLHLHAQEIDLGLERISKVATSMDLKHPAPQIISVAGTNGKGSSVAMLAAIYQAAGYQVGTYTSPHITHFNERIRLNNIPVADELIVNAFADIEEQRAITKLTYFEFSTLAALKIFADIKPDLVILEVGLGGRLDAVNVVDADASLITAIDIDHIEWLGSDRSVIATEKAGIMRSGKTSVCSDPSVPQSLLDYAKQNQVNLSLLGRDFDYQKVDKNSWQFGFSDQAPKTFMAPALKGEFQLQNAAGVLAVVALMQAELPVELAAINQGLTNVSHPGRLEKRQIGEQEWLIDVAHNPQSAQVLAEYLAAENLTGLVAVFSALNDKDMVPMVQQLAPYIKEWHIADLAIPRASSLELLQQILHQAEVKEEQYFCQSSILSAVESVASSNEQQVLVWGSFFTVSQSLQALELMQARKAS